jgi:hypothetical protein
MFIYSFMSPDSARGWIYTIEEETRVYTIHARRGETPEIVRARIAWEHPGQRLGRFWIEDGAYEDSLIHWMTTTGCTSLKGTWDKIGGGCNQGQRPGQNHPVHTPKSQRGN